MLGVASTDTISRMNINTAPAIPAVCRNSNGVTNSANQPGSVIVLDNTFECTDRYEGHGSLVNRTVRESGFQGPISRVEAQFVGNSSTRLDKKKLTPEQARQALRQEAADLVSGSLNGYAASLNEQSKAGVKNSVMNISGGLNKADVVRVLINRLSDPQAFDNVTRAFGVDRVKLQSPDPQVSGPEMRKLQQGLVDTTTSLDANPDVKKARSGYDQAVRRFESGHNSVVVAVGNTGALGLAPGVQLPANFQHSYNVNDQVTPVGASMRGIGRSDFSANERGNIVYTEGMAPTNHLMGPNGPRMGTSYAAPRISGVMAELHRRNPQLSSAQVETLMRNQLTDQRGGYTELDPVRARQFYTTP
jgi:hypothetical protein